MSSVFWAIAIYGLEVLIVLWGGQVQSCLRCVELHVERVSHVSHTSRKPQKPLGETRALAKPLAFLRNGAVEVEDGRGGERMLILTHLAGEELLQYV